MLDCLKIIVVRESEFVMLIFFYVYIDFEYVIVLVIIFCRFEFYIIYEDYNYF